MGKFSKALITLILSITVFLIVGIGFAPKIISSDWGRSKITSLINNQIAGEIQVSKLNVTWFEGQIIEDLTLKDPDNIEVLTVKNLSTSQPFWSILLNGIQLAHSRVTELNVSIIEGEDGISNLESALSSVLHPLSSPKDTRLPPLKLNHVNGAINIPSNGTLISGELSGLTEQGDLIGHFEIEATHLKQKPENIEGVNDLALSVRVENFPVNIIDHIIGLRNPQMRGFTSAFLGKKINLRVDESQNGSTAHTQWDAKSDNLTLSLSGYIDPTQFSLASPAKAELTISPTLMKFLTGNRFSMKNSSNLTVWLQDLIIPWDLIDGNDVRKNLVMDLEFDLSQIGLTSPSLTKEVVLNNISGELIAPKESKDLKIHVIGKAVEGDNFQFQLDTAFVKPLNFYDFCEEIKKRIDFDFQATGLPTVLLTPLLANDLNLESFIGEELSLGANGQIVEGHGDFAVVLSSDKFTMEKASFEVNNSLTVKKPFKINYILTPSLFNQFDSDLIPLRIIDPTHIQMHVEKLKYPLLGENLADSFELKTKLLSASEIHLRGPEKIGDITLENVQLTLSGTSFDSIESEFNGDIFAVSPNSMFKDALNGNTHFYVTANLMMGSKEEIKIGKVQADIDGADLKVHLAGVVKDKGFDLSEPATIRYLLDPTLISGLSLDHTPLGKLDKPTPLLVTVAPMDHPFTLDNIESINLSGDVSLPELSMTVNQRPVIISEVVLPWDVSGSDNRIRINFSGRALEVDSRETGTFRGKYVIKDWISNNITDWSGAEYKLKLDLIDFPSNTFGIIDEGEDLSVLLGSKIHGIIDIQSGGGQEFGEFDINIEGDRFKLKSAMVFRETLRLENPNNPAELKMTMTPERFKALQKYFNFGAHQNLELQTDANISLKLNHLRLPWKERNFHLSGLQGKLLSEKMSFIDHTNSRALHFNQIEASVNTENLSKSIEVSLKALPEADKKEGFLTMNGTVYDLFTKSGLLNLDSLSVDFNAKAQKLESDVFSRIFAPFPTMPEKVEAILGNPIDLNSRITLQKMSGPVTAELTGTNGKAFLDGQVDRGGFKLNKPFVAEVSATPELGQYIFSEIAPFLSPLKGSNQPITLTIDPEGFFFPISNFSKDRIVIGNCTIDAGRMIFRNERQIRSVLGILGAKASNQIPIWLTPIYINMKNGKVYLKRVDMLVNNRFPMAAWGKVDLIKEKVDMIIGITGYALINAFNLEGIDPEAMLQIPFKGSLKNPKLDKKKATARISSMVAESHGIEGKVLGTFIDIASGNITEGKVPSPTTHPVPWHDQLPKKKEPESPTSVIIEKPVEKIQEGAEKLIQKIFR
ncbi:MAG: hypothetical protein VX777_03550 [Chlamydiota bacterium]|nr:hypothetical protein [Chlamydiota bacterium]